jgi:hypothetical protein
MFTGIVRGVLSSVFECVVQFCVPAGQRYLPSVNEQVTDVSARFQQVAVSHHDVGNLAGLN